MGSFIDIQGDPNEVGATGAQLRALAESFEAKTKAILGDINAVEAERPWGSDKYGNAFEASYHQTGEGGDTPLSTDVKDGMSEAGRRLARVGQGTVMAMTEYQGVDAQNSADLRNVAQA